MGTIQLVDQILHVRGGGRDLAIDLSRALRATMYARPETRPYEVNDGFSVRRAYPLADGLRVEMVHSREGLFVPLVFRPHATGFRVTVEAARINEQYAIDRKLLALHVLPDLLRSRVGQAGWYLLPCFSGVLVNLGERAPTINRDRLYMEQPQWEKLNLFNAFAANIDGQGCLAVVHRGDFFCHVTSEYNQAGENRLYASFGLRHHAAEPIKAEDKEILFHFADGNRGDYPALAHRYREYLLTEGGVSPLKPRLADNPVLAYSVAAMRVKIFMALKQQPFAADGRAPVVSYTTCEEATAIRRAMQAAGIDKAVLTLVGWNLGGHDGAYPTRFPVEPLIGGEAGLRQFIAESRAEGYQVVPHDNWTDLYRVSPDYDPDTVAVNEHGQRRTFGRWGGGQALKACPLTVLERYGHDFDRVRDLGFDGHYYLDAQSTVLWTCHHPQHPADEQAFMQALARIAEVPRTLYGAVAVEMGASHHLASIDEAATIPLASPYHLPRLPPAFRELIGRFVPFYHIAVHGLVTYQSHWVHGYRKRPGGTRKGLLMELGVGARPSMEVEWRPGGFGDVYTDSIAEVKDAYRTAFVELTDIHAEPMESFAELTPECTRITYGNGTTVTTNWSDKPVDGLAPLAYRVER